MCHATDYAHLYADDPLPEAALTPSATPDDEPEPRPRDVSGPPREYYANAYESAMAMDPCTACGRRGHHHSWHQTPAQISKEAASQRSLAGLPLEADALAFARTLR